MSNRCDNSKNGFDETLAGKLAIDGVQQTFTAVSSMAEQSADVTKITDNMLRQTQPDEKILDYLVTTDDDMPIMEKKIELYNEFSEKREKHLDNATDRVIKMREEKRKSYTPAVIAVAIGTGVTAVVVSYTVGFRCGVKYCQNVAKTSS